jgi:hypothetical protein
MVTARPRSTVRITSSLQIPGSSWTKSPTDHITVIFVQGYQVSYEEYTGTR